MKYFNWFRTAGRVPPYNTPSLPPYREAIDDPQNQTNFVTKYNEFLASRGFNIGQVECIAIYDFETMYFFADMWLYSLIDGTGKVIHHFGDYLHTPIPKYGMDDVLCDWIQNNKPHTHKVKNRMGIRKRRR